MNAGFQARIDRLRERLSIAEVIGRATKLRGSGAKLRGKCPFHGSKSESFAVDDDTGRARCWGCGWSGDALQFVIDHYGLSFRDALDRMEAQHGLDGLTPAPIQLHKRAYARPAREVVPSRVFGRHHWDVGVADPEKLRIYLGARGIPEGVLEDSRLRDIRFVAHGPIAAWPVDGSPADGLQAPAMVGLIRRAPGRPGTAWEPIGAHLTFLRPDLRGKMDRRRRDGEPLPARKMAGRSAGGCVVLGDYRPEAPLFVGEGIETVFSGMVEAGAGTDACGLAVLSLDNLQGHPRLRPGGLPLYDPQPDPARAAAVAFAHEGPVTGLIDADMRPLKGTMIARGDAVTAHRGVRVIERKGGPTICRTITTAERAELCAALFVAAWRAKGCRVGAIRPRMGSDFNDAVRGLA